LTARTKASLDVRLTAVQALSFAPAAQSMIAAPTAQGIQLWDAQKGELLRKLTLKQDPVRNLSWAPNGKQLAAVTRDNVALIWDVTTGRELRQWTAQDTSLLSVGFAADGQALACGSGGNAVACWNVNTGAQLWRCAGGTAAAFFSPDARTVALPGSDHVIYLRETTSGKELGRLSGHAGQVKKVSFSANGKTVASSGETDVLLWDIADLQPKPALSK
jgi:WD40 repeat protein